MARNDKYKLEPVDGCKVSHYYSNLYTIPQERLWDLSRVEYGCDWIQMSEFAFPMLAPGEYEDDGYRIKPLDLKLNDFMPKIIAQSSNTLPNSLRVTTSRYTRTIIPSFSLVDDLMDKALTTAAHLCALEYAGFNREIRGFTETGISGYEDSQLIYQGETYLISYRQDIIFVKFPFGELYAFDIDSTFKPEAMVWTRTPTTWTRILSARRGDFFVMNVPSGDVTDEGYVSNDDKPPVEVYCTCEEMACFAYQFDFDMIPEICHFCHFKTSRKNIVNYLNKHLKWIATKSSRPMRKSKRSIEALANQYGLLGVSLDNNTTELLQKLMSTLDNFGSKFTSGIRHEIDARSLMTVVKDELLSFAGKIAKEALMFIGITALFYFATKTTLLTSILSVAVGYMVYHFLRENSSQIIEFVVDLYDKYVTGIDDELDSIANENFNDQYALADMARTHSWLLAKLGFGLVALLTVKVLPTTHDFMAFQRTAASLPRAIKGITELVEIMEKSIKGCELFIRKNVLGQEVAYMVDGGMNDILEIVTEIEFFSKKDEFDKIKTHYEYAIRAENVYRKALAVQRKQHLYSKEAIEKFRLILKPAHDLWIQSLGSIAQGTSSKVKPPMILLAGGTHVGKTTLTQALQVDILRDYGITSQMLKDNGMAAYMYLRNCDQEFWDGYKNQKGVLYDDIFQRKDTVSAPNPELYEIIAYVNSFTKPLHMAALEDKANTNFTSEFVIGTTNATRIDVHSLICGEAITSRISHPYLVEGKPEYLSRGPDGHMRVDPRKALAGRRGPINLDVYDIYRAYIDNNNVIQKVRDESGVAVPITYREMANEFRQAIREAKEGQQTLEEFFSNYLDNEENHDIPALAQQLGVWDITGVVNKLPNWLLKPDDIPRMGLKYFPQWLLKKELTPARGFVITQSRNIPSTRMVLNEEEADVWFEAEEHFSSPFLDRAGELAWSTFQLSLAPVRMVKKVILDMLETFQLSFNESPAGTVFMSLVMITASLAMAMTIYGMAKQMFRPKKKVKKNRVVVGIPCTCDSKFQQFGCMLGKIEKEPVMCVVETKNSEEATEELRECGCMALEFDPDHQVKGHHTRIAEVMAAQFSGPGDRERPARSQRKRIMTQRMRQLGPCGQKYYVQVSSEDFQTMMQSLSQGLWKFLTVRNEQVDCEIVDVTENTVVLSSGEGEIVLEQEKIARQFGPEHDKITSKIQKNIAILQATTETNAVIIGQVLFVQGTVAIMPLHFKQLVAELRPEYQLSLRPVGDSTFQWISRDAILSGHNPTQKQDVWMFDAGKEFHQRRTLVKTWLKESELHKVQDVTATVITRTSVERAQEEVFKHMTGQISLMTTDEVSMNFVEKNKQHCNSDARGEVITYAENFISTNIPGRPSQCGSPFVLDNNLFQGKIGGFMVGGSASGRTTFYNVLSREEIEEGLKKFEPIARIHPSEPQTVDITSDLRQQFGCQLLPEGTTHIYHHPTSTKLRQTPHAGMIFPISLWPARLKMRVGEQDPLLLGLEKCMETVPLIDPNVIEMARIHTYQSFQRNSPIDQELHKRVLTFEESVAGIEGEEFYEPVNKKSSPGHPWIHMKNTGLEGKKEWFSEDVINFSSKKCKEVQEAVDYLLAEARQERRAEAIFVATKKDELRKPEKVHVPRLFSAGPMHYVIAARQYFLSFAAWLQHNRIHNGIGVGINPFSEDWNFLAKKLKQFPHVIAGDFKNFDGSIPSSILSAVIDMVNDHYDDSEENKLIRQVLGSMITRSQHLINGEVFQWSHSLPSGNPFTAIFNSIINNILIRMVWIEQTHLPLSQFEEHVYMIGYGDDNVISVSNEAIEIFNFFVIQRGLAKYGMTFTDESKTGIELKAKTLEECSFLKRRFLWNERMHRYVAPLELKSIGKMINWYRQHPNPTVVMGENLAIALRELSLHGETVFNEYEKKIKTHVKKDILKYCRREPNYRAYIHMWMNVDVKLVNSWFCGGAIMQLLRNSNCVDSVEAYEATIPQSTDLPYLRNGTDISAAIESVVPRFNMTDGALMEQTTTDMTDPVDLPQTDDNMGNNQSVKEETSEGVVDLKVNSEETTIFTETTKRIQGSAVSDMQSLNSAILDTAAKDYDVQHIKSFLQTAVPMDEFTWQSSNAALINCHAPLSLTSDISSPASPLLAKFIFPEDFIANASISQKLNHMTLLRANFVVRIVLNSQPFQQGSLFITSHPIPGLMAERVRHFENSCMTTLTSMPGVIWNLAQTNACEFYLEYVAPKVFYDLTEDDFAWWNLYVYALTPLYDPQGTGVIQANVFAFMDNVELRVRTGKTVAIQSRGPTQREIRMNNTTLKRHVPEPMVQQFGLLDMLGGKESNKQNQTGAISSVTSTISNVAKMFSFIPGVAEIAEPVADIADMATGVAQAFGQSKPTTDELASPIQMKQNSNFLTINGNFNGYSMATIERNSLDPMEAPGGCLSDEMVISKLCQRQCVLDNYIFQTGNNSGDIIYQVECDPVQYWFSSDNKTVAGPPFTFALAPFTFYNCGWRFVFRAMKTQYHSGKVEIYYVPHAYTDTGSVDLQVNPRVVWDLKTSNEITIECPYVGSAQWLENPTMSQIQDGSWTEMNSSSGRLSVVVLNKLTASDIVSSKIDITVEMYPMKDLTFGGGLSAPYGCPLLVTPTTERMSQQFGLLNVQRVGSSKYEHTMAQKIADEKVVNRMAEPKISLTNCATTTGEVVLSARALMKRNMPCNNLNFDATHSFAILQPNMPTMCVALQNTTASLDGFPDWINWFQSAFIFRRGGMRMTYYSPGIRNYSNFFPINTVRGTMGAFSAAATLPQTSLFNGYQLESAGEQPVFMVYEGFAHIEVPHYSKYHVLVNEYMSTNYPANGKVENVRDGLIPHNFVVHQQNEGTATSAIEARYFRSARDDFTLSTFMGVPMMYFKPKLITG